MHILNRGDIGRMNSSGISLASINMILQSPSLLLPSCSPAACSTRSPFLYCIIATPFTLTHPNRQWLFASALTRLVLLLSLISAYAYVWVPTITNGRVISRRLLGCQHLWRQTSYTSRDLLFGCGEESNSGIQCHTSKIVSPRVSET